MVVLICYRFCIFLYNVISCTHIGYCIVMIDYMYYIYKQDNATLILPALGEQDLKRKMGAEALDLVRSSNYLIMVSNVTGCSNPTVLKCIGEGFLTH